MPPTSSHNAIYRAVADFSSLSKEIRKARRELRELKREEDQFNKSSARDHTKTMEARKASIKSLQNEAKAYRDSTASFRTYVSEVQGASQATKASARDHDKLAASQKKASSTTRATSGDLRSYKGDLDKASRSVDGLSTAHARLDSQSDRSRAALARQRDELGRFVVVSKEAETASERSRVAMGRNRDELGRFVSATRSATAGVQELDNASNSGRGGSGFFKRLAKDAGDLAGKLGGLGGSILKLTLFTAIAGLIQPLIVALGALGGVAIGAATALGQLAGAAAAIPGAFAVLATAIGSVVVATRGIGEAFKTYAKMQENAGKEAAAAARAEGQATQERIAQARRIRDAQESITAARENQARVAEQSAEKIKRAEEAVVAARENVVEASRRVVAAERDVKRSQEDAIRAQRLLNNARREAIRDLDDMRTALKNQQLDEAEAQLNVRQAQIEYKRVMKDSRSTDIEKEQALIDLRRAELDLKTVRRQTRRDIEDLNDSEKKSIEGSDKVVDAKRNLEDAQLRAAEAGLALADAQTGVIKAQKAVLESEKDVVKAQKESARAQRDAAREVRRALESLGDAQREQGGASKGAANSAQAFKDAMDKLSPSAQKVVKGLIGMKDAWAKVQKSVQERFFREVVGDLDEVKGLLPTVENLLGKSAGAMGRLASKGIEMLSSGPWKRDFRIIADRNAKLIDTMGDAGLNVADAFRNITVAAGPFVQEIADALKRGSENFKSWSEEGRKSGKIADGLKKVWDRMKQFWRITKNLLSVFFDLGAASSDFTDWMLDGLEKITGHWKDVAREQKKAGSPFKQWLEDIKPLLSSVAGFLGDVSRGIADMASDPENIRQTTGLFDKLRTDVLPAVLELLQNLTDSGVTESLTDAFVAILDVINKVIDSGGGGAFQAFATTLGTIADVIGRILDIPGVGPVLGTIATALGTIAAITFAGKATGIFALAGAIKDIVNGEGPLGRILDKIKNTFGKSGGGGAGAPITDEDGNVIAPGGDASKKKGKGKKGSKTPAPGKHKATPKTAPKSGGGKVVGGLLVGGIAVAGIEATINSAGVAEFGQQLSASLGGVIGLSNDDIDAFESKLDKGIGGALYRAGESTRKFFQSLPKKADDTRFAFTASVQNLWDSVQVGTYTKIDEIRQGVNNWWSGLQSDAATRTADFATTASVGWENLKTGTAEKFNEIRNGVSTWWNGLQTDATTKSADLGTSIGTGWNNIQKSVGTRVGDIRTNVSTWWDNLKKDASSKGSQVGTTVDTAWININTKTNELWGNIRSGVGSKWEEMKKDATRKGGDLRNNINTVWTNIQTSAGTAWENISRAAGNGFNQVKGLVAEPINWVISSVYTNGIKKIFDEIATGVGLKVVLPPIGPIQGFAQGGAYGKTGGRVRKPMTLMGEEAPQHEEYVIPTNPAYRKRARGLVGEAASKLGMNEFKKGGVVHPLPGSRITQGWSQKHGGIDFAAPMGSRINSAAGGTVNMVKLLTTSYGKHAKVDHGGALETLYGHMSKVMAKVGQGVFAGSQIGKVGSTGNSTGPHLHFELRKAGKRVDPRPFLANQVPTSAGGGLFDFIGDVWSKAKDAGSWLKDKATAALEFASKPGEILRKFIGDKISGLLPDNPGLGKFKNVAGAIPNKFLSMILSKAKDWGAQIGGGFGLGNDGSAPLPKGGGNAGANQRIAQVMLRQFGFGGGQWAPLRDLWQGESGWRHTAENPSSGAYGIPQALPGFKMGHAPYGGPDWRTNPATQIRWGLGYIKCVPLDTPILTRRGWVAHDEVQIDDETIGYNPQTGTSEWTRITAVHHYESAPVVEYQNSRWRFKATPHHEWLSEKYDQKDRRYKFERVRTDRIGTRHRIILSAPAQTDSKLDLSNVEAELLGWLAGDGYVSYGKNNRGGGRNCLNMTFTASEAKPVHLERLRSLLDGITYSDCVKYENHWSSIPCHNFRVSAEYGRSLLTRSGFHDLQAMVLNMSDEQRSLFLAGLMHADGHVPKKGSPLLTQNEGEVLDAALLAIYLLGHYPHPVDSAGQKHVVVGPSVVKGQKVPVERVSYEPVWCVTTELGSWTMRQYGNVMLTGNSRYKTPANAYSQWQHRSPHWYGRGTKGASPGWSVVGERGPEMVKFKGGEYVHPMAGGGIHAKDKWKRSPQTATASSLGLVPGGQVAYGTSRKSLSYASMSGGISSAYANTERVDARQFHFNTTINNPVAETGTESLVKRVTRVGQFGMLASRGG